MIKRENIKKLEKKRKKFISTSLYVIPYIKLINEVEREIKKERGGMHGV